MTKDNRRKAARKAARKVLLIARTPLPIAPIELVKYLESAPDAEFHSIWNELVGRTGEALFTDDDN